MKAYLELRDARSTEFLGGEIEYLSEPVLGSAFWFQAGTRILHFPIILSIDKRSGSTVLTSRVGTYVLSPSRDLL